MSNVLDDPEEFKKNPLYNDHIYGDFTAFYATISICTIFALALFILNIFFCWCSSHRQYWKDSDTVCGVRGGAYRYDVAGTHIRDSKPCTDKSHLIYIIDINDDVIHLITLVILEANKYRTLSYLHGNRWLLPVWIKLPSRQPPLDLSELEASYSAPRRVYDTELAEEFVELPKRESDL